MWSFDAADVTVLQHRQDSLISAAERCRDLATPAHSLACLHGQAYPICGRTPTADGPADPRVRVVEVRCDLDEIKYCVLDAGTGREHYRMSGPQDCIRPVDDDALDLRLQGVPGRWDRDRYDRTWFVYQAMPFSRRLMAKNCAGTGAKQGGPQNRLPGRVSREGGINPALQPLPAATTRTVAHRVWSDAGFGALAPGDQISLG